MTRAREGSMEYAQARLSARFGTLPDDLLWARIGPIREHAALLDALRASALARWVRGVSPTQDVHAIEAGLRGAWREEVREIASWMPAAWQSAVLWWERWLDLALMQHLGRHEPVPSWIGADPARRELVDEAVRHIVDDRHDARDTWLRAWQTRWPDHDASRLHDVARALRASQASDRASPSRSQLRRAMVLLFRRTMLEPAAAFCYLATAALDVQRLRGELVRSSIFGARGVHA